MAGAVMAVPASTLSEPIPDAATARARPAANESPAAILGFALVQLARADEPIAEPVNSSAFCALSWSPAPVWPLAVSHVA